MMRMFESVDEKASSHVSKAIMESKKSFFTCDRCFFLCKNWAGIERVNHLLDGDAS